MVVPQFLRFLASLLLLLSAFSLSDEEFPGYFIYRRASGNSKSMPYLRNRGLPKFILISTCLLGT